MSIFETATRKKFRFVSDRGLLTTEDLWDLSLEELDVIAVELHQKVQDKPQISFIEDKRQSTDDEQMLKVAKAIIQHKLRWKETAVRRQQTESQNARIREIIAKKQDAELEDLDVEELKNMLAANA